VVVDDAARRQKHEAALSHRAMAKDRVENKEPEARMRHELTIVIMDEVSRPIMQEQIFPVGRA
jgi:hypothetical protein